MTLFDPPSLSQYNFVSQLDLNKFWQQPHLIKLVLELDFREISYLVY